MMACIRVHRHHTHPRLQESYLALERDEVRVDKTQLDGTPSWRTVQSLPSLLRLLRPMNDYQLCPFHEVRNGKGIVIRILEQRVFEEGCVFSLFLPAGQLFAVSYWLY